MDVLYNVHRYGENDNDAKNALPGSFHVKCGIRCLQCMNYCYFVFIQNSIKDRHHRMQRD